MHGYIGSPQHSIEGQDHLQNRRPSDDIPAVETADGASPEHSGEHWQWPHHSHNEDNGQELETREQHGHLNSQLDAIDIHKN